LFTSQAAIQTIVLFILLGAGFLAGKLRYIDEATSSGLSKFLVNIVLPALVIMSMQRPFSPELRKEALTSLAISVCVYAASFPLALLFAKAIRAEGAERGAHEFAAVFSNVAFMGYPVMEAFFGKESLFAVSIYNLPFSVLAFSVGPYLLSHHGGGKARMTMKSFITPSVLASAIGLAFFFGGVKLPTIAARSLSILGDLTTPLSMVIIGAIISRTRLSKLVSNPRVYATSAYRLVVFPLLVYAVLYALGLRGRMLAMPVVMAAMPVAVNSAILAKAYGGDAETASSLVLITTLASLATIPFLAALFPAA